MQEEKSKLTVTPVRINVIGEMPDLVRAIK
jgi:hypothetical protein